MLKYNYTFVNLTTNCYVINYKYKFISYFSF